MKASIGYDSDENHYEDDDDFNKSSFQVTSENDPHEHESKYEESFEDDQESIDNIPAPRQTMLPINTTTNNNNGGNQKVSNNSMGGDDEYADDFETDQQMNNNKAISTSANPTMKPTTIPQTQTQTSKLTTTTTTTGNIDYNDLTAVEQIMQRWSNTDSNKIALDLIGRARSNDEDDENLKRGMLPASAVESPMGNKKDTSKVGKNKQRSVFVVIKLSFSISFSLQYVNIE